MRGICQGDDYVFNREGEYDVEFYPRRLMGSAKSGKVRPRFDRDSLTQLTPSAPGSLGPVELHPLHGGAPEESPPCQDHGKAAYVSHSLFRLSNTSNTRRG